MKKVTVVLLSVLLAYGSALCQDGMRNKVVFDSGDLLVSSTGRASDGELSKAQEPYAVNIVGVFNETTLTRNVPSVLESGIAYVKFNIQNGPVQKGDYVTSSTVPGYAMKALQSGFVAGIALEDSETTKGLLKIRVQVGWVKM